ncbi:MAG: hypothetical protein ACYC6O_03240 [Thermoleophilia bacterium]
MLDTLLRCSDDIKKKVPPKRHFNLTGSLNAGVITAKGVPGLIEKFFDRAVLKEPGEKLGDVIVGFHLLRGFVDVEGADRIQLAPVIRTETQVTFVHDPLCASGGSAFVHLFTHLLVQNVPRFRQRVGAAPIASVNYMYYKLFRSI